VSGRPADGAAVDGAISRFLHAVNRPARETPTPAPSNDATAEEQAVLDRAERYLADGLALWRWWQQADASDGYQSRFDLERTFNRADSSFGFFDELELRGARLPVMGNVQELMYDNPRVAADWGAAAPGWIRDQVRAFVLRYFMRVSDFRQPESAEDFENRPRRSAPLGLDRFSWCESRQVLRIGFGFTQLFYKLRSTGAIGRFSSDQSSAIVDLREIGSTYDWIILRVRIFDFSVRARLFGARGPELVFTLNEDSYLIVSPELITNRDDPEPGVLGEYGVAYSFIKSPQSGLLAYGPGEFEAAVEDIRFRVLANGQIRVRMVFVANRPASIASVSLDPIDWAIWSADVLSGGAASELLRPLRDIVDRRPFRLGTFDPVYGFVSLANVLSGGLAAGQLCISRETLDKLFLVQHFRQHYQTIVGSLLTWRQIEDWTDEAALPRWVITGHSA
jgi:hypothetical protein